MERKRRITLRLLFILLGLLAAVPAALYLARPAAELAFANAAVVSVDPIASNVGVEILKQGGNAVDAAVATGFALAVTWPAAGNLGGGGFMLIYLADKGAVAAIDYREKAPEKSTARMFLDEKGEIDSKKADVGYLVIGVPGTVRGFWEASRQRAHRNQTESDRARKAHVELDVAHHRLERQETLPGDGSPGARTIIKTVLQVIVNVIDFKMDAQAAVDEPRIHHQWMPDQITLERPLEELVPALNVMGDQTRLITTQGDAHSILVKDGMKYAGVDHRVRGGAAGY